MRACGDGMKRLLLVTVLAFAFGTVGVAEAQPNTCNGLDINDGRATESADFLTGSADRDVIALAAGNDQYFAADSGDIICGNAGDDLLVGEAGNDELNGGSGDDTLVGMTGSDEITAGYGMDSLDGGSGTDTLVARSADDTVDSIYDGLGSDTIVGNAEDIWYRCDDGVSDDASAFTGTIVDNPNNC